MVIVYLVDILVCAKYSANGHCRYRRTTHVTPKSYLSFLQSYKTVYRQKHTEIGELADRMMTGETASRADDMVAPGQGSPQLL